MKYEGKVLRSNTKEELAQLCEIEGIDTSNLSRGEMIKVLMAIDGAEDVVEPVEEVVADSEDERSKQIAYDKALAARLGGRVANSYEQELARRRGVGTRISGPDAVAVEIARRRRMYGK